MMGSYAFYHPVVQGLEFFETNFRTLGHRLQYPGYRALILLGLALCLPSASVSSVLMVLYV